MKALVIGWLLVGLAMLGPACTEDKCRNPKRGEVGGREGVLVQCNAVVICFSQSGGNDTRTPLRSLEDPQITDTGREDWNRNRCIEVVKGRGLSATCHGVDASPAVICLDVDAAGGPELAPTGGTIVTVGAAATGDFKGNDWGADGSEGLGGASGARF